MLGKHAIALWFHFAEVTLSGEVVARLWDTGTGKQISELKGHKDLVSSAKFSPSGNLIVTSSYDKTARLWDGKTGAAIAVLRGHTYVLRTALFNATETRILTLSGVDVAHIPDDARLWDAATGNEIARLRLGEEKVSNGAFSPLGNRIVTTTEAGVARLWDAHTGAWDAEEQKENRVEIDHRSAGSVPQECHRKT